MVSLVQIAGTDDSFLVEGQSLQEILNGYNKYAGATSIYNEFNSNLPDGFLDSDWQALLDALANQSETPSGPSYSGAAPAASVEDRRGDGAQNIRDSAQSDTFDYTQGEAVKFMEDNKILAGGFSGVLKGIFGGKGPEEGELFADSGQKLSEANKGSFNLDRTFDEYMKDSMTVAAGRDKFSGVGSAFLAAITMNPVGMWQGLMGHRANTETKFADEANQRFLSEQFINTTEIDSGDISFDIDDVNYSSRGRFGKGLKATDFSAGTMSKRGSIDFADPTLDTAQEDKDNLAAAKAGQVETARLAEVARKEAEAKATAARKANTAAVFARAAEDRRGDGAARSANQQNERIQNTRGGQTRSWNSGV